MMDDHNRPLNLAYVLGAGLAIGAAMLVAIWFAP